MKIMSNLWKYDSIFIIENVVWNIIKIDLFAIILWSIRIRLNQLDNDNLSTYQLPS